VQCAFAGDLLHGLDAKPGQFDALQQVSVLACDNRADARVHLVDQAGLEVFPDRRYAAADADVLAFCGGLRAVERGEGTVGADVKRHARARE
jgi:hypothetical protein